METFAASAVGLGFAPTPYARPAGNDPLLKISLCEIDVPRMMKIVLDAGYRGDEGIEYSGYDGVQLTDDRLTAAREQLTPQYE